MDSQTTPFDFEDGREAENADGLLNIADRDVGEALERVIRLCGRRVRANAALVSSGMFEARDCIEDIFQMASALAHRIGCTPPPRPAGGDFTFDIGEIEKWAVAESKCACTMRRRIEWNPREVLRAHLDALNTLSVVTCFGFSDRHPNLEAHSEIELEVHFAAARVARRLLTEIVLDPVPNPIHDLPEDVQVLQLWYSRALERAMNYSGPLGKHSIRGSNASSKSQSNCSPSDILDDNWETTSTKTEIEQLEIHVSWDGWGWAVSSCGKVTKIAAAVLTADEWFKLAGFASEGGRRDLQKCLNAESERRQIQRIGTKLSKALGLASQPISKVNSMLESRFAAIVLIPSEGES